MFKKLLLVGVLIIILYLSPLWIVIGLLVIGSIKSNLPYDLPKSTAQVETVIADPTLTTTFINLVAPTFRLDDSSAVFYDETTDTTKVIHFPDLQQRKFAQFKGTTYITGRGETILIDFSRNTLIMLPKDAGEPQVLQYSADLSGNGLGRYLFDPARFILDSKLFAIENGQVREVTAVDGYEAKFQSALTMIDSSRLDAPAFRYHARITCEDILSETVPEYKKKRVIFTEQELECLVDAFPQVYLSGNDMLIFTNPNEAENPASYLVVHVDLNHNNEDYLRKLIKPKRAEVDFGSLEILGKYWDDYVLGFPITKHNFGIGTSILSEMDFLQDIQPGVYPQIELPVDTSASSYNGEPRVLYLAADTTIATDRTCYKPTLDQCHGYQDLYTFTTDSGTSELYRLDAALVAATAHEAFFVTENGVERVTF